MRKKNMIGTKGTILHRQLRQRFFFVVLLGFVFLLRVNVVNRINRGETATATAEAFSPSSIALLSRKYVDIANAANQEKAWPRAADFASFLDRDSKNGRFIPPTFEKDGPIGVIASLSKNADARTILADCSSVFDTFCLQVKQQVFIQGQEEMDKYILRSPESTYHITISMFQEHPDLLLDEDERQLWKPVTRLQEQSLLTKLSKHQIRYCASPTLLLDSLLWTPDGAMIAGFVDVTSTNRGDLGGAYDLLKSSSVDIAKSVIGEHTSRKKNLIHVTIGRIVGMPAGATDAQQSAVTELVRLYNQVVLPQMVASIRESSPTRGRFVLSEITLLRSKVWLNVENIEYGSWTLKPTIEAETK